MQLFLLLHAAVGVDFVNRVVRQLWFGIYHWRMLHLFGKCRTRVRRCRTAEQLFDVFWSFQAGFIVCHADRAIGDLSDLNLYRRFPATGKASKNESGITTCDDRWSFSTIIRYFLPAAASLRKGKRAKRAFLTPFTRSIDPPCPSDDRTPHAHAQWPVISEKALAEKTDRRHVNETVRRSLHLRFPWCLFSAYDHVFLANEKKPGGTTGDRLQSLPALQERIQQRPLPHQPNRLYFFLRNRRALRIVVSLIRNKQYRRRLISPSKSHLLRKKVGNFDSLLEIFILFEIFFTILFPLFKFLS